MQNNRLIQYIKYSLYFVLMVGVAALIGYQFNITTLVTVRSGYAPMNPLSAICFILTSLWLLIMFSQPKDKRPSAIFPPLILAIIVLLISVIRVIDIISGTNFSLDDIMYKQVITLGRMSPPTALCFVCLGVIMSLTNARKNTKGNFILFLLSIVLLFTLLSLYGYLIGNNDIIMVKSYSTMAIHTTVCFVIVTCDFLLLYPDNVFLKEVRSGELGGYSARTLLPFIILVPLILGLLSFFGQASGVYNNSFGSGIQAVFAIFIFLFLIWRQAKNLNRIDRQRKDAEKKTEEYSHNMEQFAFIASHDLKEPLRKISIVGDMLQRSKTFAESDKKNIEKIRASSLRMQTLIEDLLNFTQLKHEEAPELINLDAVIASVLNDLEMVIAEKQAVVHYNGLPHIEGVPFQIHQLFYNLTGNALKFSTPGVPPVIHISSTPLQDYKSVDSSLNSSLTYCHITVQDNGIGFDQDQAVKIFDMFKRLSGDKQVAGSGIGLAVCKKIVLNHMGRIYAKSELTKGTTFHVILPEHQF